MTDQNDRNLHDNRRPASARNEGLSFRRLSGVGTDLPVPDPEPTAGGPTPSPDRMALYEKATRYLKHVLVTVRGGSQFDLAPGLAIMEQMVTLREPMDALFLRAIHSDEAYDFVVNHSVNVAIYAVSMAANLGFSHQRQVEIGMVGLLHDVGMAKLPESLIYKTDAFSDAERIQFRERPNLGYTLLRAFETDHGYLAECALQVHERIDGAGYPRGLKVEEIHEYAQIVGLVDVYEALIHNRPQREKVPHFFAVKEIIKTGKSQFQRRFLKALLNTFSIFPLQSHVRLNSNAIGRVIATDSDQPLRPRLKILFDSHRNRVLTDRVVDLTEHPLLYITDSVSDDEMRQIRQVADQGGDSSAETVNVSAGDLRLPVSGHGSGSRHAGRHRGIRGWFWIGLAAVCIGIAGWLAWGPASTPPSAPKPAGTTMNATQIPVRQAVPETPSPSMAVGVPAESAPHAPAIDEPDAPAPAVGMGPTAPMPGLFPYSLRISGHRRPASAEAAARQLRDQGLVAYWNRVDLKAQGVWYRVFVGVYPDAATATDDSRRLGLTGAKVKHTAFTAWIGAFPADALALSEAQARVTQAGFSPYTWVDPNGNRQLGVGAFYTRSGAAAQVEALADSGIQARVLER